MPRFIMTDEIRLKMRNAKLGTIGFWRGKKRPSVTLMFKGKKLSDEHKEKLRQAKLKNPVKYWKGKKRPEIKNWMSNVGRPSPFKGKKRPELQGENNPCWIKDRTQVKLDKERGGPLHKQWSRSVKNRDGWKCRISNDGCFGPVVAHHILGWKDYPELRYQINNGITLCHAHHPRKRSEEKRLSPYFQDLVSVSKE